VYRFSPLDLEPDEGELRRCRLVTLEPRLQARRASLAPRSSMILGAGKIPFSNPGLAAGLWLVSRCRERVAGRQLPGFAHVRRCDRASFSDRPPSERGRPARCWSGRPVSTTIRYRAFILRVARGPSGVDRSIPLWRAQSVACCRKRRSARLVVLDVGRRDRSPPRTDSTSASRAAGSFR